MEPPELPYRPRRISDELRARWIAAGLAALSLALGMYLRFGYDLGEYLPPKPPKPRPVTDPKAALRAMDYNPEVFRSTLERDAEHYGIPRASLAQHTWPFSHELVDTKALLAPGGPPLETRTLRLALRTATLHANTAGGSYSTEHLILTIENKTDQHLAYLVRTSPMGSGGRCGDKADLPHNALALRPGEKLERTECVWRKGMSFAVGRVETLALPPLSYHYVSRVDPLSVGLDARTSRAHRSPEARTCTGMDGQRIRIGLEKGKFGWRDVIDFHARHDCEKYLFPLAYRAFTRRDEYVLPVAD